MSAADSMTAMNALTVADALVAYALQPDSTDERIRRVIAALREFGYTETADTMERLNEHSVKAPRMSTDFPGQPFGPGDTITTTDE